jgi:hypothetical protein
MLPAVVKVPHFYGTLHVQCYAKQIDLCKKLDEVTTFDGRYGIVTISVL